MFFLVEPYSIRGQTRSTGDFSDMQRLSADTISPSTPEYTLECTPESSTNCIPRKLAEDQRDSTTDREPRHGACRVVLGGGWWIPSNPTPIKGCYPEIVRTAVAYCVAIALLGMASEVALLHCPFLVASKHPPCCPAPNTPKKCPLSPSFDTCPYVARDSKIEQTEIKTLGAPPPAIGFTLAIVPSSRWDDEPTAWTPSPTDLHIRIRVLLI